MRTPPVCLPLVFALCAPAVASKNHPEDAPGLLEIARAVRTAPGDLPRLKTKQDGKEIELPLEHTHVFAEVVGPVARVDVVQTYGNPFEAPIEAVYVFPLPENSAVDDMKIKVADRIIRARIRKRADARKAYEAAKEAGHTAALLEQERPNIFTQSVANIAPGEKIEVMVRYVQHLTYDAGEYEFVFPMVVGPRFIPGVATGKEGTGWSPDTGEVPDASRITPPIVGAGMRTGHDISLEVVVEAGLPIVDFAAPTHAVDAYEEEGGVLRVALSDKDSLPNRDFVMRYRVDGKAPQVATLAHRDERGGFFSLVIQPPRLDVEKLVGQRELIFVVDVSGSMFGVPLGLAKDAMRLALAQARPVDTFNIYTFAGNTQRLFDAPRPANDTNLRAAMSFLSSARAGGGTYLAKAVDEALGPGVTGGRHRYVFFLTDGYVGNEKAIFSGAERLVRALKRKGQRARVFGLGTGGSVNRHLLDGLAKAGEGVSVYVTNREDPARAVNRFYRSIDHAVLSDVRIDWGDLDVEATYPAQAPDLFATRPLVVHGRYGTPGRGTVTIRARAGKRDVVIPVEVVLPEKTTHTGALASLWARAKVADLSRRLWDGHDNDAVEAITKVGLEFRLVTAYTSFVAVDHSRSVGDGSPEKVVQPVEAPEGVDVARAAPPAAVVSAAAGGGVLGSLGGRGPAVQYGAGGLGVFGTGAGGGGAQGIGTVGHGYGRGAGKMGKKERRVRVPSVRAAQAVVTGSLDRSIIQRVIRRHRNQIRRVYESALKASPKLAGKVVVKFTVGADGKVTKAEISESTLKNKQVEEGILRVVKRWIFPKPAGGSEVEITYPFVFSVN